ncbi:DoxX family protein [Ruania rhizosphaerae]|uniref:DoxX family protein n=1 Tax=Ruania rhizosphaerae TaxID=1840413 RepID=UPI0013596DED|nr:DoxX family protein [Ruania rhizosphaerae]
MSTTLSQTATGTRTQDDLIRSVWARRALAIGRIVIGFSFLWPFLDKTFGLGFTTPAERAWINGGTPAQGYLGNLDPSQPLAGLFQDLFLNPFGDALFMIGLLGIGVAMITGAGLRIAAVGGALLMLFMYLVALPWIGEPATNPIIDSHWHEALLLIVAALTLAGDTWGLGKWWAGTAIVQRLPWLR